MNLSSTLRPIRWAIAIALSGAVIVLADFGHAQIPRTGDEPDASKGFWASHRKNHPLCAEHVNRHEALTREIYDTAKKTSNAECDW